MDSTGVDWTNIVVAVMAIGSFIVAAYAAGLSTWIAVSRWREKRPDIAVEVSVLGTFGYGRIGSALLLVARNRGERAVVLSSHGFVHKKTGREVPAYYKAEGGRFPEELGLERKFTIRALAPDIARHLKAKGVSGKVRLVGFFRDELDRIYRSKPFEFDVDGHSWP